MSGRVLSGLRPPFVHKEPGDAPVRTPEAKGDAMPQKDWRAFDWKSVASLRAPENPLAKSEGEWDATDWDDPLHPVSQEARSVAEQLDQVAQRIRRGELNVVGRALTPETAIAAALEALIRAK